MILVILDTKIYLAVILVKKKKKSWRCWIFVGLCDVLMQWVATF